MTQSAQAVDLAHLDRYTGGDQAINAEVLSLFEGQCFGLVDQLDAMIGADNAKAWHQAAHTLKGAARGIGAFALADAAQVAEAAGPARTEATLAAITRLKETASAVHSFITAFLAKQP